MGFLLPPIKKQLDVTDDMQTDQMIGWVFDYSVHLIIRCIPWHNKESYRTRPCIIHSVNNKRQSGASDKRVIYVVYCCSFEGINPLIKGKIIP